MNDINGSRLSRPPDPVGADRLYAGEGTTRLPYTPAYDEGRTYVRGVWSRRDSRRRLIP